MRGDSEARTLVDARTLGYLIPHVPSQSARLAIALEVALYEGEDGPLTNGKMYLCM